MKQFAIISKDSLDLIRTFNDYDAASRHLDGCGFDGYKYYIKEISDEELFSEDASDNNIITSGHFVIVNKITGQQLPEVYATKLEANHTRWQMREHYCYRILEILN